MYHFHLAMLGCKKDHINSQPLASTRNTPSDAVGNRSLTIRVIGQRNTLLGQTGQCLSNAIRGFEDAPNKGT